MKVRHPFLHKQKVNIEKTQLAKQLPISGFGHIVIPSDVDRDQYVKFCFKSGFCMIIDNYGTVFRNVLIPKNQIDLLRFPQDSKEYGSLVGWLRVEQMNAVAITNVYFDGKELSNSGENRHVYKRGQGETHIVVSETTRDSPIRTITVRGNNEGSTPGGHEIHTRGSGGKSTQVKQDLEGNVIVQADSLIRMQCLDEFVIEVIQGDKVQKLSISKTGNLSYTDSFGSVIEVNEDRVLLEHTKLVQFGAQGEEFTVKGESLVNWLRDLTTAITQITVPTAQGPSLVPINNSIFNTLKEQLDTLKSTTVKSK